MKIFSLKILIIFFVISGNIFPITIKKMSLSDLSQKALLIARARCESIETRIGEYGLTYTYTRFKILEIIKGEYSESSFIIRSFGDYNDNKLTALLGQIKFSLNEEAILFLTQKDKFGYHKILGVNQGSYKLTKKDKKDLISNTNDDLDTFKKEIFKLINK